MSDIPSELFRETLIRVPATSLFRFRSVCKTWCRIIDDSDFAKSHINGGLGSDEYLIIRNGNGKVFLLSLRHLIYSKSRDEKVEATNVTTIVGRGVPRVPRLSLPSCNGLILISTCKKDLVWLVWNPFNGEFIEIPQCDEFQSLRRETFDLPRSGIGYDEASDDYKVVRIVKGFTFIYSLSVKTWRRIDGLLDCNVDLGNGAFVKGALHWAAYSNEPRNYDSKSDDGYYDDDAELLGWIVALDLSTETYRKIPLPSGLTGDNRFCLEVYSLGGVLFLSCYNLKERYVVWMLKDYGCGNKWVKVLSVLQKDYGYRLRPIAYLKIRRQILLHYEKGFLWYDVGTKSLTRVSLGIRDIRDDSFSYQVSPASLVHFKRNHVDNEDVASEQTSKKKRKRPERLGMKTRFGPP